MGKETAEQKLLKLIEAADEGEKTDDQAAGAEAQQALDSVKGVGVAYIPLPPFVANLLALFKGQSTGPHAPASFGVREINKILMVAIIVLVIFFANDFMKGMKTSQQDVQFAVNKKEIDAVIEVPSFNDLAEYVAAVARRNIFQPYEKKVVAKIEGPAPPPVIADRIADFKLVGISWLDTPESATAMIEDAKTNITHFLKVGDKLKGVQLKTIYADRVVLFFEGETIDVKL